MKTLSTNHRIAVTLFLSAFILISSCKKKDKEPEPGEPMPSVNTLPITGITESSARTGVEVTYGGSSEVSEAGVCWDTISGPVTTGMHSSNSGSGTFTFQISDLRSKKTYYVRAFATNSSGTSYGQELTFQTGEGFKICDSISGYYTGFYTRGNDIFGGKNFAGISVSSDGSVWTTVLNQGNISALAGNGTDVYVGTYFSMMKLTATNNTVAVNMGISFPRIESIACSGNVVIAGVGNGEGIYRSADNGATWNKISTTNTVNVTSIASLGNTWLAYTSTQGILRSTDNGATWVGTGKFSNEGITRLFIHGNSIFVTTGNSHGFYRSDDQGATFIEIPALAYTYVATVIGNGQDLYAGGTAGVHYSSDNGATWTLLSSNFRNKSVMSLGRWNNIIFAATGDGKLYKKGS